jgi:hypothetical protein
MNKQYILHTFPPPNHFGIHLNKIQSGLRSRQLVPAKYLDKHPTRCEIPGNYHLGKIRRQSLEAYKKKGHKFVLMQSLLPDYVRLGGSMLTPILFCYAKLS